MADLTAVAMAVRRAVWSAAWWVDSKVARWVWRLAGWWAAARADL